MTRMLPALLKAICLSALAAEVTLAGCSHKPPAVIALPIPTGADVVASLGPKVTKDSEGALTLTNCEILQVVDATKFPEVIRVDLTLQANRDCEIMEYTFAMEVPVFTVKNPGPMSDYDKKYLRMLSAGQSAKYSVRYMCLKAPGKPWGFFSGLWDEKGKP